MFGLLMDQILSLHIACALAEATWNCPQRLEQGPINIQITSPLSSQTILLDSNEKFQAMFVHPMDDYDLLLQMDISILLWYHHHKYQFPHETW